MMPDQANKLRDLIRLSKELEGLGASVQPSSQDNASPANDKPSARVITITSGKGGVGKTNFAVNLAIQMAKAGKRVVIIDADFGLSNIDVLFGIITQYSFADVLMGDKTIREVLTEGPFGIQFISGGSGMGELANITEKQMSYLLENLAILDEIADVVLIDTGAGISKNVISLVKASKETVIITTPEPTSITDAYAIIKTIKEEDGVVPEFKIVVNKVFDIKDGSDIFKKISMVAEKFLSIKLEHLGTIPDDRHLMKAVMKQQPVSTCFPNSSATRAIAVVSDTLLNGTPKKAGHLDGGIKAFMKRMISDFGQK